MKITLKEVGSNYKRVKRVKLNGASIKRYLQ